MVNEFSLVEKFMVKEFMVKDFMGKEFKVEKFFVKILGLKNEAWGWPVQV